jgi:VanZ family protein
MLVLGDGNKTPHRAVAFVTHVLPGVLYASAIFYGGLIHLRSMPEVGYIATDKLLHALAFGGLALLLARGVRFFDTAAGLKRKLALGCLGSSLLGLLLELCQTFTPYRSADVMDWLADTVGALLVSGLAFAFCAWVPRSAHG